MIRTLRYRNTIGGYNWPARDAAAVTRYPNVAAEIAAFSGHLWCPAQHAGVSKEILAAVLEDNEELTATEMLRLKRLFRCKFEYLSSHVLQLIDPATNKGKAKRRQLAAMYDCAQGLDEPDCWRVERVLEDLRSGRLVTYAAWRQAYQTLQDAGDRASRPSPRTARMAAAELERRSHAPYF